VVDIILVEVAFELVITIRPIISTRINELRAVVGDHLQDRDRTVELLANAVEEFDHLLCRTVVGLDHGEDAPQGVVFDRYTPLSAIIVIPIHVDAHAEIFALEPHPRSLAALLGWILDHVVMHLKNLVDAVVGDREAVPDTEDVRDDDRASAEALAEVENPFFGVLGMVRVRSASGRLQLRDLSLSQ